MNRELIDVAQEAEAKLVLNTIQAVVQEKILHKEDYELTIKVYSALAMLHYILNDNLKVPIYRIEFFIL